MTTINEWWGEIEGLEKVSTAGPWKSMGFPHAWGAVIETSDGAELWDSENGGILAEKADCALIVALRSPKTLAVVKAMVSLVQDVEQLLGKCDDDCTLICVHGETRKRLIALQVALEEK